MPVILENPYCSLEAVKRVLKFDEDDTTRDDALKASINDASRWLDRFLGRDFFFHDHSVAFLEFDDDSDQSEGKLWLPYVPVIQISEVYLGESLLLEEVDFSIVRRIDGSAYLLNHDGAWTLSRPDNTVKVYGTFGYAQTSYWTVTEAGDAANQLSNWTLNNLTSTDVLYWRLIEASPTEATVEIYLEEAHTNLVASGTGLKASTITLTQENASGISGSVVVNYTADDDETTNTLTPIQPATDTTQIPTGIPGYISFCAAQIAAVFSGHDRKEVVGLDGVKTSIVNNAIPKTVFDALGSKKANSVLV